MAAPRIPPVAVRPLIGYGLLMVLFVLLPLTPQEQILGRSIAGAPKTVIAPYLNQTFASARFAPALTAFRLKTGDLFSSDRKHNPYLSFYLVWHVLPSLIWCAAMPLQHSKSLRQSRPRLHRLSGYVALACTLSLSVTGLIFPSINLAFTHENVFHIHTWRVGTGENRYTIFAWPTFAAATTFLGIAMLFTGYKTLRYARSRDIARHQRWATTMTYIGYGIPIQRLFVVPVLVSGKILAHLPPDRQRWLGVPATVQGVFDAELSAFAWTTFMAVIVVSWRLYSRVWRFEEASKSGSLKKMK